MDLFSDSPDIRDSQNRPQGRIPADNNLKEMLSNVDEYVDKLSRYPEVEAILLGGGISRGYGDELSEIDMVVYLEDETLPLWERGEGPIPHGDHQGSRYHMDISFTSFSREDKRWTLLKKWDASYSKIRYDPRGDLEKLLKSKDVFTASEKRGVALKNYLDCVYYGEIVVRQWIKRGDLLAAHQLLSKGISALCNLLFLANNEYPPFEKWLINYSFGLEWKPADWETGLSELIKITSLDVGELERRKTQFSGLYEEIWGEIVGNSLKGTGLLEIEALETLRYVLEHEPTLDEFTRKYDEKHLGYEVLYKLADFVEKAGEKRIVFNAERFTEEKETGFQSFLDWNKEILKKVRIR